MRSNASRCRVRPPIGQPLPGDALERVVCALCISHTESRAIVVSEIEFGNISLQVLASNMMICPDQATLEQAEIAFDGVCMDVPAHVFAFGMRYGFMTGGNRAKLPVVFSIIGHQMSIGRHLGFKDGLQGCAGHIRNMERANFPTTLNKGENCVLVGVPAASVLVAFRFGSEKGFVGFNSSTSAAHRRKAANLHGLADTVRHEPRGFVSHSEGAVQLVAAHPFLRRAKEMHGLKPDVEGDLGAFKDSADRNSKLLAAVFAFPKALAVRLAVKLVMLLAHAAAMRAYRPIRPLDALKVFAGFNGVLEVRLV